MRVLQTLTTQPEKRTLLVAQMTSDIDVSKGHSKVFCDQRYLRRLLVSGVGKLAKT